MKFSWFIALRYLKPKGTFVSVITLISVAGVALGVGVLLVVIAVMSGFEKKIKEEILQSEPSLVIKPSKSTVPSGVETDVSSDDRNDWRSLRAKILEHPEVRSVSPVLTITTILERKPTPEEEEAITAGTSSKLEAQGTLIGIDPQDTVQMERLNRLMTGAGHGSFEIAGESLVLTPALANRLNRDGMLILGESSANIFGPSFLREYRIYYQEQQRAKNDAAKLDAVEARDRDLPLPAEYVIQGVISDAQSGNQSAGYISLKNAQNLSGIGKTVQGLNVSLSNSFRAGEVKLELDKTLPQTWEITTWMDRNKRLFDAISNERGMMYLVLAIISLVAAFCIMNTMITIAIQKRSEIGMMRALGAKTSQIVSLFINKGLIVAGFGVGSGYLLGTAVLRWRNSINQFLGDYLHLQILPERLYGQHSIPAEPRLLDTLMICGIAFILCTLAAVPPAWMVGRLSPALAIRGGR